MSKPIPRSRLNITYRTKIDGQLKKAKLPMRFLVLGDFTRHDQSLLAERKVHSMLPGMKPDSFMEELKISATIDDESLKERLVGQLAGKIIGKFTKSPDAGDTTGTLKISGTGIVSGEGQVNGLGSFVGPVEISGEIELPLGDDRAPAIPADGSLEVELRLYGKVEPPAGAELGVTGNIDARVKVVLGASELRDDDTAIDLRNVVTSAAVLIEVTIPLRSISDFKPLHLAASVPEIRRLVLLHRLVLEARNYISSFPELREVVKAELGETKKQMTDGTTPRAGADTRIGQLGQALRTLYPQLMVDPTKPTPAAG